MEKSAPDVLSDEYFAEKSKRLNIPVEVLRERPHIITAMEEAARANSHLITALQNPGVPVGEDEKLRPAIEVRPGRPVEGFAQPEWQKPFDEPIKREHLYEEKCARLGKHSTGGKNSAEVQRAKHAKMKEKAKKLAVKHWEAETWGLTQKELAKKILANWGRGDKPAETTLIEWVSEWQNDGTLAK